MTQRMHGERSFFGTAASIALLAAAFGMAGCSSEGSGSPPRGRTSTSAAAPSQAMITWVGKVCAADEDLQAQQGAARIVALSLIPRDPTREQIVDFVSGRYQDLRDDVKTFQKIGPSPVDGGDQVVAAYVTALREAAAKAEGIHRTAADSSMPDLIVSDTPRDVADAVNAAVPKTDLPSLLARNPTLKRAYKSSRPCRDSGYAHPLTAHPSATPTP